MAYRLFSYNLKSVFLFQGLNLFFIIKSGFFISKVISSGVYVCILTASAPDFASFINFKAFFKKPEWLLVVPPL